MLFNYKTVREELELPAFIIGNGINRGDKNLLPWDKLLLNLFPNEEKKNDIAAYKSLTYPEIASIANVYIKNDKEKKNGLIHKKVCVQIKVFEESFIKNNNLEKHKTVMNFAKTHSIPVLTTNYDHLLLKSINYNNKTLKGEKEGIEKPYWLVKENDHKRFHYWTPFNAYFTDGEKFKYDKTDVKKEFALWFIHGTKRYERSICIDDNDYIRNITAIKKYLNNDWYDKKKNWTGRNTWLDIFLNNDLIILGFGFSSSELDLRWLLLQRYAHQKMLVDKKIIKESSKVIYVTRDSDKSYSKEFFKALGVICVEMPAEDIYKLNYLKK